ncbi:hypothetical protein [Paraburkholderia sp. Ac-20347]|uniref:hypothetical protein n=1 Tax=Paraburkholderia sp. Ac-20347 TaxID=2703892 RepID=UPI001F128689|nr:hypothetical protein [Paraburkholderia sp. Ac-20347]
MTSSTTLRGAPRVVPLVAPFVAVLVDGFAAGVPLSCWVSLMLMFVSAEPAAESSSAQGAA